MLGLGAFLRHRGMTILDDDCGQVPLCRVLGREGKQYGILEARFISQRQPVELDVIETTFEDLRGLRHCFTYGASDLIWLWLPGWWTSAAAQHGRNR
ncbi:hypothetical protein LG290_07795 [Halomonas sediminis]